jgi:2-polyprenyl-3-methyl-5-hydroxy-6-metoxy-1,4-benzoquinol methylase
LQGIDHYKLSLKIFKQCLAKPQLYEKSTKKFWDDPYISAQMLNLHLNTEGDSASRKKATVEAEAAFIIRKTGITNGKVVLDLGCGPGLYVIEFAKTGANVTGIDLSDRSISYANENIKPFFSNVDFKRMNYLDLAYEGLFDIITLIFYDFCVLSPMNKSNC